MKKLSDRFPINVYYNLEINTSNPPIILEIINLLSNYYSKLGVDLFVQWLYKLTKFDNKLECLTEGYSSDEILIIANNMIQKLVDSKLYTFVDYYTEDGYYFDDDEYNFDIRREYIYYIFRCYYSKKDSERIIRNLSNKDLVNLHNLEEKFNIKFV